MATLQRKASERLRKLSDTIRNVVAPKPERPSKRITKDDIRVLQPGSQEFEEAIHRKTRSTDDLLYRSTTARPNKLHRARPKVEDRPLRTIVIPRVPPQADNRRPPHVHANSTPIAAKSTQKAGSSQDQRRRERPVPVPFPTSSSKDASAAPYRFPPEPSRKPVFTPFKTLSRQPESSISRSYAGKPSPPPVSSAPATAGRAFPTLPPVRQKTMPLDRSTSFKQPRESVYCSTGAATVRRHGAIRRTSSSGDANLPPQHARYRPERSTEEEREARRVQRTAQVFEPPAPSSKPSTPTRDLPMVKPRPPGVPHDVSPDPSSESEYTETPRSSLMLFPPAPVATTSMVAKVQGTMHVKASSAPRPVQMSSGDLHRALSHKAHVEGTPHRNTMKDVSKSKSRTTTKRTVEMFGMEIFELERAQAVQEEGLAQSTPAPGVLAPIRPLAIQKRKEVDVKVRKR
ncbi:hypothetical protein C8Q74DRAFT_1362504 [Fomes fomentarius]|nr:hypothetical protein C8Q74DRAFT_1362504 [Fomes fomentarius]